MRAGRLLAKPALATERLRNERDTTYENKENKEEDEEEKEC
jgi:hypothetical protein